MGKFSLFYASVQHVGPLCMHWPLAQPFPVAWADSTGQCLVFISLMSMAAINNGHGIKKSPNSPMQFYLFADLSAVSDEERKRVLWN